MKLFITFFVLIFSALVAHADVAQLGNRANLINVYPVAPVTVSGASSAVDLLAYSGNCAALLDVSAPVSGTNPTLTVKLTESATSGGSYTDMSGGGFSAITSAALAEKLVFNKDEKLRYVKLDVAIGGTAAPQYLVSGKILCDKKVRP